MKEGLIPLYDYLANIIQLAIDYNEIFAQFFSKIEGPKLFVDAYRAVS